MELGLWNWVYGTGFVELNISILADDLGASNEQEDYWVLA